MPHAIYVVPCLCEIPSTRRAKDVSASPDRATSLVRWRRRTTCGPTMRSGRARRVALLGRGDSCGRREGAVHRPNRHRVHDERAHRAARQSRPRLDQSGLPRGESCTVGGRNADVRECSGRCAATPPEQYELTWFRFDNATDQRTPIGRPVTVSRESAVAPGVRRRSSVRSRSVPPSFAPLNSRAS